MRIAIILSGGIGTRLGGTTPKQYIRVNDRMIISYCLKTISECKVVDGIWIVAGTEWKKEINSEINALNLSDKLIGYSIPGENRQLSIWNALVDIKALYDDIEVLSNMKVLIHDAARPMVTSELIEACFSTVNKYDGALPVLPMKDTIYYSNLGERIDKLLDRQKLFAGQAPEAFDFLKYYHANEILFPDRIYNINGSTEPAILADMEVSMIDGDENNFKITTESDLIRFREMVQPND